MKLAIVGLVMALAMIMTTIPLVASGGGDIVLCNMTNDGLNACKPSVCTDKPPVLPPTKACCDAIASADIKCLCKFKKYSYLLKENGVDLDLALNLPKECKLPNTYGCSN